MTDHELFKNYFINTLGFSDSNVDGLMLSGLTTFATIKIQSEKKLEILAKNLPASADALPLNCSMNLEMLRYYLKHQDRISSNLTDEEITQKATLMELIDVYEQKQVEDTTKEVDYPKPFVSIEKIRVKIEEIKTWCADSRGLDGTPLSYVIRDNDEPLEYVDGEEWSIDEECINRHPLKGKTWKDDNKKVWKMMNHIFHDTAGWSWIQPFHLKQDGRGALESVYWHYMDDSTQHSLYAKALEAVTSTIYKGETRNFNFENFVCKLKMAHTDMEALGLGFPEEAKCVLLLKNIHSPAMEGTKTAIIGNTKTYNTFDKCVNYLKHKTHNNLNEGSQRQISEATIGNKVIPNKTYSYKKSGQYKKGGAGKGKKRRTKEDVNNNFKPENRFYPTWEWRLLSSDNKQRVRALTGGRSFNEQNRHISQVTTAPLVSEFTNLGDSMNRRSNSGGQS